MLVSLLTNPRYTSQAVFIGTDPVCSGGSSSFSVKPSGAQFQLQQKTMTKTCPHASIDNTIFHFIL